MKAKQLIENYNAGHRDFSKASLAGAKLERVDLKGANLIGANLQAANLRRSNLDRANLYRANLRSVDLNQSRLRDANLIGALMNGAKLRGAYLLRASLSACDLSGAVLEFADLRGADMFGADLHGARLNKVDLGNASLRRADLKQANLVGADLVYMSEDAWLGFYFVKRAVIPEFSTSFVLPFLVGFHKAKEIIFFGDKITAREAEQLGLVNKVLPSDELLSYAREQALRLIPPIGPSLSLNRMKKVMHDYFKPILSKTLDLENEALRASIETSDFRAATKSLITKEEPKFKGK